LRMRSITCARGEMRVSETIGSQSDDPKQFCRCLFRDAVAESQFLRLELILTIP
jgi:hypothetical protein